MPYQTVYGIREKTLNSVELVRIQYSDTCIKKERKIERGRHVKGVKRRKL